MAQERSHRRRRTWAERQSDAVEARNQPQRLAELVEELRQVGESCGLAVVGVAGVEPLADARAALIDRVERGLSADMGFTFGKAEAATTPAKLLPNAASVVVGALSYRRADGEPPGLLSGEIVGHIARYQREDFYGQLRAALRSMALVLRDEGWRSRVLADDNVLVDRAIAHRAGIGWFGKNANLLIPAKGSWFVLGSIVTDAPLPQAATPVEDGCGTCARCIPACPTDAIVAPGVIDARRCLAWLVQAPGDIPEQFRQAMGSRLYGCDDCQSACPENKVVLRKTPPPTPGDDAQPTANLEWIVNATDDELLAHFARLWMPERNPDVLRRNAVVALGNVASPVDQRIRRLVNQLADVEGASSASVRTHAQWALQELDRRARGSSGFEAETFRKL
jgi:epoxyqueuosine reductase